MKLIKVCLVVIAVGIWVIVLQNFGVLPHKVDVANSLDAYVRGSVNVDNTVDVNLSEINGHRNCFYNSYSKHPNDYYRIPVAEY